MRGASFVSDLTSCSAISSSTVRAVCSADGFAGLARLPSCLSAPDFADAVPSATATASTTVAPNFTQMRDRRFFAIDLRNRYNDRLAGGGQSWKSLSDILPNPGRG